MNDRSAETPPRPDRHGRTLGDLFLAAEHSRTRRSVLRWKANGQWQVLPGWRFFRQVIRIGLFLRDRMGVGPGDGVFVWSPLRAERVVAEWATVAIGAVVLSLDGEVTDQSLRSICASMPAKAAFVERPDHARRLLGTAGGPPAEAIVVLRPEGPRDATRSWLEVLDLGGTLDTAERARSFRADLRTLKTEGTALAYRETADGAPLTVLRHGEMVDRLRAFWRRVPARDGDVAYLAEFSNAAAPFCLPLWAFVVDGRTSTVLGTAGRETDETAELRPHVVVAPPALARRIWSADSSVSRARTRLARALARIPVVRSVVDRVFSTKDDAASPSRPRAVVSPDGRQI